MVTTESSARTSLGRFHRQPRNGQTCHRKKKKSMSRCTQLFIAFTACVILVITLSGLHGLDAGAQGASARDVIVVDPAPQPVPVRNTNDSESTSPLTGGVHALFNLHHLETGPFPSDIFTVTDRTHNTGRRVNLPYPDCALHVSDCEDLDVINTLDGFGLQTRISIPFDGPIDVDTATSETVFLIRLGSTLRREDDDNDNAVQVVGINQVVWDVQTNTLHVECDELLAQHTRYALIVTNGMRDAGGQPVEASKAFRRFRQTVRGRYKHALLEAIHAARRLGVRERHIVTASVYTTQSVTSVMERIRDQIKNGTPAPANFLLGPNGERAVFNVADVSSIVSGQHTTVNPTGYTTLNLELPVLQVVPGAVGTFASGIYVSPDYQVHPGEYIPTRGKPHRDSASTELQPHTCQRLLALGPETADRMAGSHRRPRLGERPARPLMESGFHPRCPRDRQRRHQWRWIWFWTLGCIDDHLAQWKFAHDPG